jgi:hypothetical protein
MPSSRRFTAIIIAVTLGITVSRHLVNSHVLATADPAQSRLLRRCRMAPCGNGTAELRKAVSPVLDNLFLHKAMD